MNAHASTYYLFCRFSGVGVSRHVHYYICLCFITPCCWINRLMAALGSKSNRDSLISLFVAHAMRLFSSFAPIIYALFVRRLNHTALAIPRIALVFRTGIACFLGISSSNLLITDLTDRSTKQTWYYTPESRINGGWKDCSYKGIGNNSYFSVYVIVSDDDDFADGPPSPQLVPPGGRLLQQQQQQQVSSGGSSRSSSGRSAAFSSPLSADGPLRAIPVALSRLEAMLQQGCQGWQLLSKSQRQVQQQQQQPQAETWSENQGTHWHHHDDDEDDHGHR